MPNRQVSEVIGERSFVTAPVDATVRDAARMMKKDHSSAVLIVDKGVLAGICTERDIVIAVVAAGLDPEHTKVSAIMTRKVETISPTKPFGHALHMMYEGGFRHVPVVDSHGRPLGLLAARDALNIDAVELEQELVRREEITVIL